MRKEITPSYIYIEATLKPESDLKVSARAESEQLGLSAISISQTEAHLIQFICGLNKPKKIVEIGTLTGLSAIYLLELLPTDGKLWTFEKSPLHIEKAKRILEKYLHSNQCEIIEGDARENLPKIETHGPFDIIFIDGNKAAYYDYWIWAKNNISKNGLIVIDNVFLAGAVWGDQSQQKFNPKQITAVKEMTTEIINSSQFRSTFIPTTEGLLILQNK